jgi:hypothetical protein
MHFGMPGRCRREVIGAVNHLKNFSLGRVFLKVALLFSTTSA